jgi:hypothetical protein
VERPAHDLEIVDDEQLVEVELDQLAGAFVQDNGILDDRDALAGMDDGGLGREGLGGGRGREFGRLAGGEQGAGREHGEDAGHGGSGEGEQAIAEGDGCCRPAGGRDELGFPEGAVKTEVLRLGLQTTPPR